MKILLFLMILFAATPAKAQVDYMEEARTLGIVAGQGLACGSAKYDTFELLARAIILTKSPNARLQSEALKAFTEEKANIFVVKQLDKFAGCAEIVERFNGQDIFKTTLYADGTLKMPDGQIITPREPYDATKIYDKKLNVQKRAAAIYNKDTSKTKKIKFEDAYLTDGKRTKPSKSAIGKQKIISAPRVVSQSK